MRIWWCQEHEQSALGGASPSYCTSKHYWPEGYPVPCRMVPMRLIPQDDVEAIRDSLFGQWEYNHAEHCSNEWPHPEGKRCIWEQPVVLKILDGETP